MRNVWLGGVSVADRTRFESRPVHCQVTTLGKLFTHMYIRSPSSIIWYRSRGGDVLWLGR